jgi:D-alanyl-D-alanine carboxypeptidase
MANTSNKGSANTALGGTLEAAFCGKKPASTASASARSGPSTLPAESDLPEHR